MNVGIDKRTLFVFGGAMLLFAAMLWYRPESAAPLMHYQDAEVRIGEAAFAVDVADVPEAKNRGLGGRESIGGREGMWFVFDKSSLYPFWMKGMMFSIDIVWISEGRIVGFEERLPVPTEEAALPPLYYPPEPVDRVLELRAGAVKEYGLLVGQEINFVDLRKKVIQ